MKLSRYLLKLITRIGVITMMVLAMNNSKRAGTGWKLSGEARRRTGENSDGNINGKAVIADRQGWEYGQRAITCRFAADNGNRGKGFLDYLLAGLCPVIDDCAGAVPGFAGRRYTGCRRKFYADRGQTYGQYDHE